MKSTVPKEEETSSSFAPVFLHLKSFRLRGLFLWIITGNVLLRTPKNILQSYAIESACPGDFLFDIT